MVAPLSAFVVHRLVYGVLWRLEAWTYQTLVLYWLFSITLSNLDVIFTLGLINHIIV